MEQNKYFTPNIEDIRVGYECEQSFITTYDLGTKSVRVEESWMPVVIQHIHNHKHPKIKNPVYRVSYLTKEQIENEGWVRQNNYFDETKKQRIGHIPDYELKTEFGSLRLFIKDLEKPYEHIDIERYTKSDPNEAWSLSGKWFVYRGQCKDINTFRYICKLLNIK